VTEAIGDRTARERQELADPAHAEQGELLDHLRIERQHVERQPVEE
jgi:hypothetical protein